LKWIGQNANYEAQYEAKWFDTTTDFAHDTMIAHHVLWPGTSMDLTYLSSLYTQYHRYWGEASWWEETGRIEDRWTYNCEDAARTWEIGLALESLIDKMSFRPQFEERMEVARANLDLMLRGVKIDLEERRRQGLQVFTSIQAMEESFTSLLPSWIPPLLRGKGGKPSPWFRSNTQQMRLFYDLFGQPEHRDKKTKSRTVDDDALQKIAASEPFLADLCADLLDYRSAGVYYNNFLTAELDADGRLRCSIGEGPVSFRMRSGKNAFGRGTNLQNVPKEKDL
jgi:DNA polymerase I-like protein with 3'-5' exonuclease and polymerase domains